MNLLLLLGFAPSACMDATRSAVPDESGLELPDEQLVAVSDELARNTNIQIATRFGEGYAPPSTCDGNYDVTNPSQSGNFIFCRGLHDEELTYDGHFFFVYGCFVGGVADPNFCRTYKTIDKLLSDEDWLALKKEILSTQPLSLQSISCEETDTCYADGEASSVTLTIDGQTKVITWVDNVDVKFVRLNHLVTVLEQVGFQF